jgi:hypothetical protein
VSDNLQQVHCFQTSALDVFDMWDEVQFPIEYQPSRLEAEPAPESLVDGLNRVERQVTREMTKLSYADIVEDSNDSAEFMLQSYPSLSCFILGQPEQPVGGEQEVKQQAR